MPSYTVFKGIPNDYPKQAVLPQPDTLTGDNVLLKVTASGLCGTDLHYRHLDMVLGHEGVGIVEQLGPDIKYLKKGDRVGWGYVTDSCGHCIECLQGTEVFCPQRIIYGTGNFDQGSFASHAVIREAFLHKIPDNLSDEDAAPLQCGGATVYTALTDFATPSETVGIMGVGGLGHLAIQFAAKMGYRVVVFSSSERKKEEAIRLGAHDFIATKGKTADDLKDVPKLARLIVTTAEQPEWDIYLPLMAPGSRIIPLTVSAHNLNIPYMPLILGGISVVGSCVANRPTHRRMLEFAALHDLKPVNEIYPMTEEGIKTAIQNLEKGQVHFRAVLLPQ